MLIRNTPGAADSSDGNDDYGGSGVFLANIAATPGVLVTHHVLTGDQGQSADDGTDAGTDGGGVEIYHASNTQVLANTIADNDVALETGASPDGICAGSVLSGNQVSGLSTGSTLARSPGLILRRATAMVASHNTFTNLSSWVYDIETNDIFSTSVNGLAITHNTVSQADPVYILGVDPVTARLVIEANRFARTGSTFALFFPYYGDDTSTPTLTGWQQRTGLDLTSTSR